MKQVKKTCAVLFCMILVLSGLPTLAFSAEAAPGVTLEKTVDYKSRTATIDVYIDNANYTDSYQINIKFDNRNLTFKECIKTNKNDILECNSQTPGLLTIGEIFMQSEQAHHAKIASITFSMHNNSQAASLSTEIQFGGTAWTSEHDKVELSMQTITVDLECPHANTEIITPEVPATCDTWGDSEAVGCKDCGKVLKQRTGIAPLGHSWDNGTADKNGDIVYTCTRCGKIKAGLPSLVLKPTVNGDIVSVDIVVKNDSAESIYAAIVDFDKTELEYKSCFFSDEYLSTLNEKYKGFLIHDVRQDGKFAMTFATKTALENGTVIATIQFNRIGKNASTTLSFADGSCVSTLTDAYDISGSSAIDFNSSYIKGDVDGDGEVAVKDARLALRAAVDLEKLIGAALAAADVDGIEGVSVADARLILMCAFCVQTL